MLEIPRSIDRMYSQVASSIGMKYNDKAYLPVLSSDSFTSA